MSDANELWEQQPLETDTAFAAFALYRDAGHARSLKKTAHVANTSLERICIWVKNHRWRKRIEAYTLHMDRLARANHQADLKAMGEAHLGIAALLIKKGMERLMETAPEELKPGDAARFIQLGVDLEKQARGYAIEELSPAEAVLGPLEAACAETNGSKDEQDAAPPSFADTLERGD